MKTKGLFLSACCPIAIGLSLVFPLSAQLLIHESFDYSLVGDELIGQPDNLGVDDNDATGLNGTWADAAATSGGGNDMFLKAGSLAFSDLSTSGNHIGFLSNANSDIYHRSLTTTGFTQPTIYFSFLFEKLQNNFGADHEGFALMNGVLPQARWDSGNAGAVGRHGFAVAAVGGSNLQAVAYDGTTGTQIVSISSIPITVVNGSSNTSTSNVAVSMIVGEISFNTGTSGADVFKLYSVTDDGSLDASDLTLIDTIEGNVDESLISTLNLTRQVNVNYDEIRIGNSLSDVIPSGGSGGTGFSDWIAGFEVGDDTGFDQDPDGDGIDSGMEAFFGTAPDSPTVGISGVTVSSSSLTFTHPEADPQLADVTGSYMWSLDLSAWNASGANVGGTIVTIAASQNDPVSGTTTVTAAVTGIDPGKVFVRAVATQD